VAPAARAWSGERDAVVSVDLRAGVSGPCAGFGIAIAPAFSDEGPNEDEILHEVATPTTRAAFAPLPESGGQAVGPRGSATAH
jgi:hypothetical protein